MKCKKTESRSEKKSQANKEASEMKAERERIMNKMRVCVTVREQAKYKSRRPHYHQATQPHPPRLCPRASFFTYTSIHSKKNDPRKERVKNQKYAAENIQVGSSLAGFGGRGCLSAYLCAVLV